MPGHKYMIEPLQHADPRKYVLKTMEKLAVKMTGSSTKRGKRHVATIRKNLLKTAEHSAINVKYRKPGDRWSPVAQGKNEFF